MAKRAEADVFALLVELVAVLDDNPDDLGVVVQPPGHGDDVKPDAWTAEVCDMAGMHHVAGAIARAPTGTAALRGLVVGLRDQLERRVRDNTALIARANAWLEANHG